jgi:replicative DNA helicase
MWSKGLKAVAKDLGITVIPIAQLSRYVEHRETTRPQMSDIKGSSQIEADSDVVSFLFHKDPKNKLDTTFYIAKQRNGPCGDIELEFMNHLTLFKEKQSHDDF